MVEPIEVLPTPHGGVAPVSFVEAIVLSHRERLGRERFFGHDLAHDVVVFGQQCRAFQLDVVGDGHLVDPIPELHAETLDLRPLGFVHETEIEGLLRDLEVGLHHLGSQQQSVLVVLEALG